MYRSNKEIIKVIKNENIIDVLCGKEPYEVECSRFTSDVFTTDINAVLVNYIYNIKSEVPQIDVIFQDALTKMIFGNNPSKLYIAILYFDACIFQEERKKASFNIDRELLAKRISDAVNKNRDVLEEEIVFYNGMKKKNAMRNIMNFNKYYERKYKFSII
ncbi:hypothetical protein [uncultured Eubacterium sp.]|jgi:spore germination protein GerM|uniref:hypothetical protein n=1 Tax=uncultured Eubacterium sp. TaxID=165185 RepID=UPI0026DBE4B3|nr:hypothetical protein [uncultured Eubacterium sp.]